MKAQIIHHGSMAAINSRDLFGTHCGLSLLHNLHTISIYLRFNLRFLQSYIYF